MKFWNVILLELKGMRVYRVFLFINLRGAALFVRRCATTGGCWAGLQLSFFWTGSGFLGGLLRGIGCPAGKQLGSASSTRALRGSPGADGAYGSRHSRSLCPSRVAPGCSSHGIGDWALPSRDGGPTGHTWDVIWIALPGRPWGFSRDPDTFGIYVFRLDFL